MDGKGAAESAGRSEITATLEMLMRRADSNAERISTLEQRMASTSTLAQLLQDGLRDVKLATIQAAQSVEALKMWLLGTAVLVAANLLYMTLTMSLKR